MYPFYDIRKFGTGYAVYGCTMEDERRLRTFTTEQQAIDYADECRDDDYRVESRNQNYDMQV